MGSSENSLRSGVLQDSSFLYLTGISQQGVALVKNVGGSATDVFMFFS